MNTQTHRPNRVRPATVRNRIMWVLGVHGVEPATAESIWSALTSGNDPMPEGVPTTFRFQGVDLVYPMGVGTRLLYPVERKALNAAISRYRPDEPDELLDSEDSAEVGRHAYVQLWRKTQRADYVDPTSVKARMADLIEEATAAFPDPATELLTEIFTAPEVAKVQRVTTDKRSVKKQPKKAKAEPAPEPTLDDLLAQLNEITARASS